MKQSLTSMPQALLCLHSSRMRPINPFLTVRSKHLADSVHAANAASKHSSISAKPHRGDLRNDSASRAAMKDAALCCTVRREQCIAIFTKYNLLGLSFLALSTNRVSSATHKPCTVVQRCVWVCVCDVYHRFWTVRIAFQYEMLCLDKH